MEQTNPLMRDAEQILKCVNLLHFRQEIWPTEKMEKRTVDETWGCRCRWIVLFVISFFQCTEPQKLFNIANELLHTEEAYVKRLHLLDQVIQF